MYQRERPRGNYFHHDYPTRNAHYHHHHQRHSLPSALRRTPSYPSAGSRYHYNYSQPQRPPPVVKRVHYAQDSRRTYYDGNEGGDRSRTYAASASGGGGSGGGIGSSGQESMSGMLSNFSKALGELQRARALAFPFSNANLRLQSPSCEN